MQVCYFGDSVIDPSGIFLLNTIPTGAVTIVAHYCDKLTYKYVETNTFSRSSNGRMTKSNEDLETTNSQGHPFSDHQNELLKIPLNAVRTSMFSFLPFGIIIILRFLLINYSDFVRTQLFVTLICAMQGLRIVLILALLLKANQINQAEISQAEKRAKQQEWEKYHSFKAKKAREEASKNINEPQPGPSSGSLPASKQKLKSSTKKPILDPRLLEQIMEEDETSF